MIRVIQMIKDDEKLKPLSSHTASESKSKESALFPCTRASILTAGFDSAQPAVGAEARLRNPTAFFELCSISRISVVRSEPSFEGLQDFWLRIPVPPGEDRGFPRQIRNPSNHGGHRHFFAPLSGKPSFLPLRILCETLLLLSLIRGTNPGPLPPWPGHSPPGFRPGHCGWR
jgi:hypothetical protein